jgi:hypothetical protein
LHVRLECGANRFHDLVANLLFGLVEDAPERTEPRQVRSQLLLRNRANDVDGLDVDPGPAALLENAVDLVPVREGELPWRIRLARRYVGQQGRRGSLRCRHERIFRGASPGDEPKMSAASCRVPQVRECADAVVEEHDAETRNDRVEAAGLEGMRLGVVTDEGCRYAFAFSAGSRGHDHRFGDVYARAMALRPERSCGGERGSACAAANVEHAACGFGNDELCKQRFEGQEHPVQHFLCVHPGTSGRAIPKRRLLVVGFAVYSHGDLLYLP